MKINWLVEEKIVVREYKRYRLRMKKDILEKLDGSEWTINQGKNNKASCKFKDKKVCFCNGSGEKEMEMDVFCGPTGNFDLVKHEHILILNYLPHCLNDEEVRNRSDRVLADPICNYTGKEFAERIASIRELLQGKKEGESNEDLLGIIYLSSAAEKQILKTIYENKTPTSGSMYGQFILPLEAQMKNLPEVRNDIKAYGMVNMTPKKLGDVKECIKGLMEIGELAVFRYDNEDKDSKETR